MLKKIISKKYQKYSFINGVIELSTHDFKTFVDKKDICDIYFYPDLLRVVFVSKWNRFILDFESERHLESFFKEFNTFFSENDYIALKKRILYSLVKWILISAVTVVFLYLVDFKNDWFIIQLALISTVVFSIVVFGHLKRLSLFFKEKIRS